MRLASKIISHLHQKISPQTAIILFLLSLIPYSLFLIPKIKAQMTVEDHINAAGSDMQGNLDQVMGNGGFIESLFTHAACQMTGCQTKSGEVLTPGAMRPAANLMAAMITDPPVKTSDWNVYALNNLGVTPAYAQGIGFSSLSPVLELWKAFRNIAYFLFIIVFVVIGFMIMFRSQINPQTVVTVQAALPKLIVTLILITFSYAIAGFVVDLIYLSIFFFTEVFQAFNILKSAASARDAIFGYSVFRLGFDFLVSPFEVAGSSAQAVSAIFEGVIGIPWWLDWLTDALAYLIIAAAIIVALFRTLFTLIVSYVGIILSVIFAPLQLLMNAFPGSTAFTKWIRGLVANAIVFPAVALVLIIGSALTASNELKNSDGSLGINPLTSDINPGAGFTPEKSGFIPPLITTKGSGTRAQEPGASTDEEFGLQQVQGVIGLGLVLFLPSIAENIKKSLQVEPGGFGAAAAALGAGPRIFGTVKGYYQRRQQEEYYKDQYEGRVRSGGPTTWQRIRTWLPL